MNREKLARELINFTVDHTGPFTITGELQTKSTVVEKLREAGISVFDEESTDAINISHFSIVLANITVVYGEDYNVLLKGVDKWSAFIPIDYLISTGYAESIKIEADGESISFEDTVCQ